MKAKKSYGQHFLHDENICRKIADAILALDDYDILVEIGPGKGAITRFLVASDRPFYVIEADRDMVQYLTQHLSDLDPANIISSDFLKVNLEERFGGGQIALVGNFPYNISSQIVVKTLEYRSCVRHMMGMFQKEMANRILSDHGSKEYGSLSVQTAAFFRRYSVLNVAPGAFSPPPKVQSKVIGMERLAEPASITDETLFRRVTRAAFGQRRKMLRNSLKSLGLVLDAVDPKFMTLRPEQIPMVDFVKIANQLSQSLTGNKRNIV